MAHLRGSLLVLPHRRVKDSIRRLLFFVCVVQTGSAIKADLALQVILLTFRKLSENFIEITIEHGISQLVYVDLVPAFSVALGEGLSDSFLSEGNK